MVSSHFKRNEMHYCENWILIEGTISFGLTCETCNIHYNNGTETCIRACHRVRLAKVFQELLRNKKPLLFENNLFKNKNVFWRRSITV